MFKSLRTVRGVVLRGEGRSGSAVHVSARPTSVSHSSLALDAVVKAPVVFGLTLLLIWITATTVERIPLGARFIGLPRRPLPKFAP